MTPQEHVQWAQKQIKRARPHWNGHVWELVCPVCHDGLYAASGPSAVLRSLERHLLARTPVGIEFLPYPAGAKISLGGEEYEIIRRFRPYARAYFRQLKKHTFVLILRRTRDGCLFRTADDRADLVENLPWCQWKAFGLEHYGRPG